MGILQSRLNFVGAIYTGHRTRGAQHHLLHGGAQQGQFRISTYVGDAYNLFVPPLRTVNEGVDLSDPGAAKLDPDTHAAILLALAAGYEQAGRFAECVDVAVAADQLDPDISPPLRRTIQRQLANCQDKLPNRGLARRDDQ